MNRLHSQDHENPLVDYDPFARTFATSRKWKYWSELETVFSVVSRFPKPRILDVGCGSGRLYGFLSERFPGMEYEWTDLSGNLVSIARSEFPVWKFRVGDMRNAGTFDGNFNVVVFLASFHHLRSEEERMETLRACARALVPGGFAVLVNWNLKSPENVRKYVPNGPGSADYDVKLGSQTRYYHSFDPREMETLAKKAGFFVESNAFGEAERNLVTVLGIS